MMKVKLLGVVLLALTVAGSHVHADTHRVGVSADDSALVEELLAVGDAVFTLMDADDYAGFYETFAGSSFRDNVSLGSFTVDAGSAREALGPNRGRDIHEVRVETVILGDPKSQFFSMVYLSDYTNAEVYDRLVLEKEDGEWKVAGIWVVARE